MKKLLACIVVSLFFISARASKNQYADMSFQEACKATKGMWMNMQPTKDFIPTGAPACEGCMQPNGDHICGKEEYLQSLN